MGLQGCPPRYDQKYTFKRQKSVIFKTVLPN